jgi:hypothetical protein
MAKIEGYCATTSVIPGQAAKFHVYSEAGTFDYVLYRMGATDERVASGSGKAAAHATPANADAVGCGWPESFRITIPSDWRSGVYLMHLTSGPDTHEIAFAIRAATPGATSPILVMIPVTTAQAYNAWHGHSLYAFNSVSGKSITQVSFDRPGSVLAGRSWTEWEQKFIRWFETHYVADYCTSIDLHEHPELLSEYQLIVSMGHDEYWSREMRDQVEAFIAAGGNAAFFGGNTCYYQVRFENGSRTMVSYKDAALDPLTDTDPLRATVSWDSPLVGRPENTLTGVGTKHGAVWDYGQGDLPAVDYTVHFSQHWVFRNTGLNDGSRFGANAKIVGYETDAAECTFHNGVPEITGSDGTPHNFVVLASADLSNWGKPGKATLGLFRNRGLVFTAATTNWPNGLASGEPVVQQMTRNVLDRLSRPNAASPPVQSSEFQVLDGWYAERPGEFKALSGGGEWPTIRISAPLAAGALSLDATGGMVWVSQFLEPLQGRTFYKLSCWVKASNPGARIALQRTSSWGDFAVADHSGNGQWQLLSTIGKVDDEGPLFKARIRLQASQGTVLFTRVYVEAL